MTSRSSTTARDEPPPAVERQSRWIAKRFGVFLDAAPDAIIVVNETGHILIANVHGQRLFGYAPAELIGRRVELLVPEHVRGAHGAHRDSYVADPAPRPMGASLDLAGRRKDGTEFPVEISLSPLETEEGRMVVAAIRDISERLKREAKFRGLLEAAPDAMIVADRDGRILLVNGQTERLFGYQREELLGQPIEILVPSRFHDLHPSHRAEYIRDPHIREMGAGLELFGRRKNGSEFPVEISLSPLETEDGTLVTSAVRDITERKRLEDRIHRANRMKSEFLANMSHELRTPLNSVIGFAEVMYDGKVGAVSAEHKEYLGDILSSAHHLLRLINDVLDLSKVESGTMQFFPEHIDMAVLVDEVRDLVRTQAARHGIRIVTDVHNDDLTGIIVDPAKLKQVLYNYLSNALKFTPDGGRVTVRVMRSGEDGFRLEVEDTGIGISADDTEKLFIEFQQLDAGAAKKFQGTGLGLALTKRIVEAQGGYVGVRSTPGIGSLFYAVLPRVTLAIG